MMYDEILQKVKKVQSELHDNPGTLQNVEMQIQVSSENIDLFKQLITDNALHKTVEKLYRGGHHARAVEEAYKFIDSLVKRTAKLSDESLSGSKLMTKVFSMNEPILKINACESKSEQDEQLGYMQILSGCMIGIRNPRAHEYDWEDSEQRALQLLIWANHLVEKIRLSERTANISR